MITLYNAISSDGFIARKDGSEDFIPDEVWKDFIDLCKKYDTVVMGRKTYETIQAYPKEHIQEFENLKIEKIIITRNKTFLSKSDYIITHTLKDAFATGNNILLTSGSTLNTSALKEGLIDKVIFNVLPEKIGEGIKVFEIEANLILISEKNTEGGRKWREYNVKI